MRKRVEEKEKAEAELEHFRRKVEKLLDELLGEQPQEETQPEKEGRPYIGVTLVEPSKTLRYQLGIESGLVVEAAKENSPAEKAGLKKNHIILKVGGRPVASLEDVAQALEGKRPGDTLKLTVVVKGMVKEIELELGSQQ